MSPDAIAQVVANHPVFQQARLDALTGPQGTGLEGRVSTYTDRWLNDPNDKGEPNLLLQKLARTPALQRNAMIPDAWSDEGRIALLRKANDIGGAYGGGTMLPPGAPAYPSGTAEQPAPIPPRPEPNAFQKVVGGIGDVLSFPHGIVKAGVAQADKAYADWWNRNIGSNGMDPADYAALKKQTSLPPLQQILAAEHQPIMYVGTPNAAAQHQNMMDKLPWAGQALGSLTNLGAEFASDPLTFAGAGLFSKLAEAAAAGDAINLGRYAIPAGTAQRALSGAFAANQAANIAADPGQFERDPVGSTAAALLGLAAAAHAIRGTTVTNPSSPLAADFYAPPRPIGESPIPGGEYGWVRDWRTGALAEPQGQAPVPDARYGADQLGAEQLVRRQEPQLALPPAPPAAPAPAVRGLLPPAPGFSVDSEGNISSGTGASNVYGTKALPPGPEEAAAIAAGPEVRMLPRAPGFSVDSEGRIGSGTGTPEAGALERMAASEADRTPASARPQLPLTITITDPESEALQNQLGYEHPLAQRIENAFAAAPAKAEVQVTPDEATQLYRASRSIQGNTGSLGYDPARLNRRLVSALGYTPSREPLGGLVQLNAGVSPGDIAGGVQRAFEAIRNSPFGDWITQMFRGDKPILSRIAPDAAKAASVYENARTWAGLEADHVLPRVVEGLSPVDRAKFLTYGIADRMAAARDQVAQELASARAQDAVLAPQEIAAKKAATRAYGGPAADYEAAKRAADEITAQRKTLADQIADHEDTLDRVALERSTDPLRFTAPDGTRVRVTEAGLNKYFSQPDVQRAVQLHRQLVEPLLERNQRAAGGSTAGTRGKYSGIYVPAEALDEAGEIQRSGAGGGGGGRTGPMAQLRVNQNAKRFTGTGADYRGDYVEAVRDTLLRGATTASERQLHLELLQRGLAQPIRIAETAPDGKVTIKDNPSVRAHPPTDQQPWSHELNVDGKWEPADAVTLKRGIRTGGGPVGATDERIPAQVVVARDVFNELRPLFDRQHAGQLEQFAGNFFSRFMQSYLAGPADMVRHSLALGSRAAAATAPRGFSIQAATTVGRSVANMVRFFNPALFSDDLRYEALRYGARNGVLPEGFGNRTSAGAARVSDVGHNVLYGDRGVLANAVTTVYSYFKNAGALDTAEGRQLLDKALRDTFNTGSRADASTLGRIARGLGAGSFFETGIKNRLAAYQAGPAAYSAALAGRALLVVGLVKALDPEHRNPVEIPGYKWGDIPAGNDKDGKQLFFSAAALDRTGFYGDWWLRSLMTSRSQGDGRLPTAENFALDAANHWGAPFFTGPAPGFASTALGVAPHLQMNRTLSAPELTSNPSAKLPPLSLQRGLATLQAAQPYLTLIGDANEAGSNHAVEAPWARALNIPVRVFGMDLHQQEPAGLALMHEAQKERALGKMGSKVHGVGLGF